MTGAPFDPGRLTRRGMLASALALAACDRGTASAAPAGRPGPLPRLRDLAPFPVGTQIVTDQLATPVIERLASTQFSQITTGYELKMEYLLRPDGELRFDGGDRIADFCRTNGQTMHGHTLIWYSETPQAFQALDGDPRAFGQAYDRYIQAVAGRYAGRMRGWDVVNEPVSDDGVSLRESMWSRNLGQEGHFIRAFEQAHEADPDAILFVNEYHLERYSQKRATFLKLVEDMLKRGVPIGGIGTQSHMYVGQEPGLMAPGLRDLASLGLPIHVSEFDCSLQSERMDFRSRRQREEVQLQIYRETIEAYMDLPANQQYAFTIWGVRDAESWVRMPFYGGDKTDSPLAFDDAGEAKPTFWALVEPLEKGKAGRENPTVPEPAVPA